MPLNPTDLIPGDIILVRNFEVVGNDMPGFFNHATIYSSDGVIEAQMPPIGEVIKSPVNEFGQRYEKYVIMRYNNGPGDKIAQHAIALIGKKYSMISSLLFNIRLRNRVNCVSMVRLAYKRATGIDFGWVIPDDIYKDIRLTMISEQK
jgi:uncharacterized protein YycO